MTVLSKRMEQLRLQRRENQRQDVRHRTRAALQLLIPNSEVILFGSITKPYQFHSNSDVDIALPKDPGGAGIYWLSSKISEAVGRPVDLVLLEESRLKEKIQATGERWVV